MLKKAHIETLLVSHTENGEYRITTQSQGACIVEETGIMLRYAEPENQGSAMLMLTDGLADLKRNGQVRSRMTFIEGRLLPCPYTAQEGTFDFSLFTHSQSFIINATGGRFQARYTLLAAGRQVADNVLTIEWHFN